MKRSRRNAFALGKKEDGSPDPAAQSAVEEVFGVVPSDDSVVLDNMESGSERSLAHLTNEQITGNKCLEAKRLGEESLIMAVANILARAG